MSWKNFLKPNVAKIILAIVIIVLVSFIPYEKNNGCVLVPSGAVCLDVPDVGIGFPKFYKSVYHGDYSETVFLYHFLLLNIIVYYLVSCLIYKLYRKEQK